MRKRVTRTLLSCTAAGAAVLGLGAGLSGLGPGGQEAPPMAAVAEGDPGYAVEDFAYPQADKILEEQGILLKRGDGHIVLAACDSGTGLLKVYTRNNSTVCFRTTGDSGYLSLELPAVYGVQTNAYQADLHTTVEDEEHQYEVDPNSFAPVGEAADPEGRRHVLVEIVTSK
ncbi:MULTISPECIES: hypothetical protein [unclassified Streptomyces]|uniref:hypothetical protein n=1 Tax=unclassified Streptomyces TaxID=2593676 RepID=UPI00086B34EE|nr:MULTISPECIES: hypothetical protein [unclassified Streptomyces]ODA73175.1 hypothetical protein APS67_002797 [Streptomyces sp. AVP053U2]